MDPTTGLCLAHGTDTATCAAAGRACQPSPTAPGDTGGIKSVTVLHGGGRSRRPQRMEAWGEYGSPAINRGINAIVDAISAERGSVWIAVDPMISEPTRVAIGHGMPGINVPDIVLDVETFMLAQSIVGELVVRANPRTLLVDPAGPGVGLRSFILGIYHREVSSDRPFSILEIRQ